MKVPEPIRWLRTLPGEAAPDLTFPGWTRIDAPDAPDVELWVHRSGAEVWRRHAEPRRWLCRGLGVPRVEVREAQHDPAVGPDGVLRLAMVAALGYVVQQVVDARGLPQYRWSYAMTDSGLYDSLVEVVAAATRHAEGRGL